MPLGSGREMDEEAIELLRELLARHAPALELYARQWCSTPEDVVQEALLRLMNEKPLPENPVAWLYLAVRRRAISAGRAQTRRRQHESAAARSAFELKEAGGLGAIEATEALAELPLEEREILVAHIWGGLSFREIAELVGSSSSAVHRQYVAGLEVLRERLEVSCSKNTRRPKS